MAEPAKTKSLQGFKSKVYDFVNLFVTQRIENTSSDLLQYGSNNLFPNDLIEILAESGTATSSVNKLDEFIQADGFNDEVAAKLKVNGEQTADELLALVSNCLATFQAFSLYIQRSPDGKIASVKYIAFEAVRKRISGGFWYNPNYGTDSYKKAEDKIYPEFKKALLTPQELAQQIKIYGAVGEVLYRYKKKVGQAIYPIPSFYSGIEDIKTDAELSKFDYETAVNSFITSAVLTIIGEVDDQVKDEKGKTDQDYLDETLKGFTGAVKDKSGKSGRSKLAVLSARTKDEVPVLQSFDTGAIMDAANGATDRIARKVARLFQVPSFLLGLESATGFNTKMLVDQIALFNKTVNNWQRMITSVFELLYPEINDWNITTFNPINYIPTEVLAKLTDDELRALAGYKPVEKKTTSSAEATLNALSTVSPLLANELLKSLDETEKRALIGLGPLKTGTADPGMPPGA